MFADEHEDSFPTSNGGENVKEYGFARPISYFLAGIIVLVYSVLASPQEAGNKQDKKWSSNDTCNSIIVNERDNKKYGLYTAVICIGENLEIVGQYPSHIDERYEIQVVVLSTEEFNITLNNKPFDLAYYTSPEIRVKAGQQVTPKMLFIPRGASRKIEMEIGKTVNGKNISATHVIYVEPVYHFSLRIGPVVTFLSDAEYELGPAGADGKRKILLKNGWNEQSWGYENGGPRLLWMAAVSFYLPWEGRNLYAKPLGGCWDGALSPQRVSVILGTDLNDLDDNVLFGVSYAIQRGISFNFGFHYARVTRLSQGLHVGSYIDGTDIPTKEIWLPTGFVGVDLDTRAFWLLWKNKKLPE